MLLIEPPGSLCTQEPTPPPPLPLAVAGAVVTVLSEGLGVVGLLG